MNSIFTNLCFILLRLLLRGRFVKSCIIALVLGGSTLTVSFGQGEVASFTLDDYKKSVSFKLADLEEDTYVKFDNIYVLDRETKPYVFNYSDGIERRIYLYKLLKGANRDEVATMAIYTTPQNKKMIKVCIPGPTAERKVWDYYIDELKLNGEREQGFLSTLTFALSREYSREHANAGKQTVVKEDDHYDFCFPAGAWVTLGDGTQKPIEQVKVGEQLASLDINGLEKSYTTVTDVEVHYRKEGIQLTKLLLSPIDELLAFTGAYVPVALEEIEATANHPILTKEGKKEMGQVKEGDVVYRFDSFTQAFRTYKVAKILANYQQVNKVYNLRTEAGNYLVNGMVVLDK